MKRILSLISVMLIISVMVFSEEIPKEITIPTEHLSVNTDNQLMYDKVTPYTGKLIFTEDATNEFMGKGYMNIKGGYFEGVTYLKSDETLISFDVENGKFQGEYLITGKIEGTSMNYTIDFDNGIIRKIKANMQSVELEAVFDSKGKANGTAIALGEKLLIKDGFIVEDEFRKKVKTDIEILLNDTKNGLIVRFYSLNGELIYEDRDLKNIDRAAMESIIFSMIIHSNN